MRHEVDRPSATYYDVDGELSSRLYERILIRRKEQPDEDRAARRSRSATSPRATRTTTRQASSATAASSTSARRTSASSSTRTSSGTRSSTRHARTSRSTSCTGRCASDGDYEVIDGQQRTISICQYVEGDFAFEGRYFHNLQTDEQEQILDYKLMVYLCSGTDSEKLEWFKTINIAGEKLTDQELRNAVYAGPWVTDAKRYFSKNGARPTASAATT